MTDNDFLLDCLKDHQWHSTAELLRYSVDERGVGLTVHSRVSDLRARGLNIEYRRVPGERSAAHQYRLVATLPDAGPDLLPRSPQDEDQAAPARQPTLWEVAPIFREVA